MQTADHTAATALADKARSARPADRLLAAATDLFGKYGIRAVGVDRILREADCAKASLYSAYGSKDALVIAYLTELDLADRNRFAQAIEGRRRSHRQGTDVLRSGARQGSATRLPRVPLRERRVGIPWRAFRTHRRPSTVGPVDTERTDQGSGHSAAGAIGASHPTAVRRRTGGIQGRAVRRADSFRPRPRRRCHRQGTRYAPLTPGVRITAIRSRPPHISDLPPTPPLATG